MNLRTKKYFIDADIWQSRGNISMAINALKNAHRFLGKDFPPLRYEIERRLKHLEFLDFLDSYDGPSREIDSPGEEIEDLDKCENCGEIFHWGKVSQDTFDELYIILCQECSEDLIQCKFCGEILHWEKDSSDELDVIYCQKCIQMFNDCSEEESINDDSEDNIDLNEYINQHQND